MLEAQLSGDAQGLLAEAQRIAAEVAAPSAETVDRENRFPHELFDALVEARLTSLCVPKTAGGWGMGPDAHNPLPVWLVTRAIACADSSSSHCQQVHTNATHSLALLGRPDQVERYLRPVAEDGAVFGYWGSEQDGRPPAPDRQTTTARRVPGGWRLTGRKFYSTNAGGATQAVVFATPEDADDPMNELMLFVVEADDPHVRIEPAWWDGATGMRSTVSHAVELDGVLVADDAVLGEPGDFWRRQVQARYLPQFASNFQGVGRHVYDYGLSYLRDRRRTKNPWAQHKMAEAEIQLVTAELLLGETAQRYVEGAGAEAFHYSRMLRAYSQLAVDRAIQLVQNSCGASIYMHPHPLERVLRDWQFYSRHENVDLILTAIGRSLFELGGEGTPAAFGFGGGRSAER